MMSWFGRSAALGLGVGVTVSTGLIAFLIIKEMLKRRNRHLLLRDTHDAVRALTPEQQVELRQTLDEVMKSVFSLRDEITELREGLKNITTTITEDVRKTVEESQKSRRRRPFPVRERSESVSSSSIYFTASAGASSVCCDSEVGYTTAYSTAESDYTDRETDREGEDDGKVSDEEEEKSCVTVLTLRREDSQPEEDDDEDAGMMVESLTVPSPELGLLLTQCDLLHAGDSGKKAEGFSLLMENRPLYVDNVEFMWRLARAYSDMCKITEDRDAKKNYTEQSHYEAEAALQRSELNAECHKWFAVLVHVSSQNDSIHGRLRSSRVLKEHVDRALALRDDDPICFYLLGRWCFEMSSLGWLERKTAEAIYKAPPTSTLSDALENFLKAEELNPGFSRTVRLYIAKCHQELGNKSEARNWVHLALSTPTAAHEESDGALLQEELKALIDSSSDLSPRSVNN